MNFTLQNPWFLPIFLILFVICSKINISEGSDTIISGQSLYGSQTIVSKGKNFGLGFFKPGKSQNYYIGIWYPRLPQAYNKVVWVANRNQPISGPLSSSELKLFPDGNLVLLNQSKKPVWSSNSSSKNSNSTFIALLLDNGNFVIRDALDSSTVMWQSFDHPTDTWLPGGKLGYNKLRNESSSLSPWRSLDNPATSLFSFVAYGRSLLALWNNSVMYWTSGEWDGKHFPLILETKISSSYTNVTYVTNENESYFTYEAPASAFNAFIRIVIDINGQVQIYLWWGNSLPQVAWAQPPDYCDVYAVCGAFSVCNNMGPTVCNCMPEFEPKVPKDWELGDHTEGCVRKTPLHCNKEGNNTFITIPNARFPSNGVPLSAGRVEECEQTCLTNCSCTAYAYNNSGCFVWKGGILNLQQVSSDDVIRGNFHVRVAVSKHMLVDGVNQKKKFVLIVLVVVGGFFTSFCIISGSIWRTRLIVIADAFEGSQDSLKVFQYREIRIATKNFSKKLGEGSFGVVFKGTLPNSTAIAVKRLKAPIQQDNQDKQFRAEVNTIGTIQHINLVRLRGFCIRGAERFLVYDYMTNGSLESYLFEKGYGFLDWKTRYNIAIGTARGLAYIHERCKDCIVHCDIKPENILLDDEYNPKVADFGLAKLIGRDFSRVLTTIRGTIGYLAPEWITCEAITQKVDVFSFGMLLFEIISGRRNRDSKGTDEYFPSQVAYQITENGNVFDLLDQKLEGNADKEQLTRACRVACWCVQDFERNRPSMGQVVQILEGVIDVNIPSVPRFLQDLAPWIPSGPSTIESIACNTLT